MKYGFFVLLGFAIGAAVVRWKKGDTSDVSSSFTGTTGQHTPDPGSPAGQRGETWGSGTPTGTAGGGPQDTGADRDYSDPSSGPLIGEHHGTVEGVGEEQDDLEQRIRTNIGEDPRTAEMPRVNVEVNDGVAELRGIVPSEEAKEAAGDITSHTEGIIEVRNLVVVSSEGQAQGRIAERIEREISEVRDRMAPNMRDLQKHAEPQVIAKRTSTRIRDRFRESIVRAGGGLIDFANTRVGRAGRDTVLSTDDEPSAPDPETIDPGAPPPRPERRISVWVNEHTESPNEPLVVGESYTLNFMVGRLVAASLVSGPATAVPSSDIPTDGLETQWMISSTNVELAAVASGTSVSSGRAESGITWTAAFSLHIPYEGDSAIPKLRITPRTTESASLNVFISTRKELYRHFMIDLAVDGGPSMPGTEANESSIARLHSDVVHAPMSQLNLGTPHEWTTPPGVFQIVVGETGRAFASGDVGSRYGGVGSGMWAEWRGDYDGVKNIVRNVRTSAEKFREEWGDYLNDIDPDDLTARLQNFTPQRHWAALLDYADPAHQQKWEEVAASQELRRLAYDGKSLYDELFPPNSELRRRLDSLDPGQRIHISWLPATGAGGDGFPWGLMYRGATLPRSGDPIDASMFWGLRYRISHQAHDVELPSKFLGSVRDTHAAHFLYWGEHPQDPTAVEARWQKERLIRWENQVAVPATPLPADPKAQVLEMLDAPTPTPMGVLYFFCQCKGGESNDPVLYFDDSIESWVTVDRTELGFEALGDRPLVFVNACATAATQPHGVNELERIFFNRQCSGYLGTVAMVPIQFASRFAAVFFSFFYRELDPEPMAAGEAVAQTRLFLWTHYKNIGGLFYAYVNQYELFMAQDSEIG